MTATISSLSRLRKAATHLFLGVALLFPALQANAGDFTLDWSTIDWPAGQNGPYLIPLFDSNGFRVDTVIGATGTFAAAPIPPTPDDLAIFGGSIEGFTMISDAAPQAGSVGESTVVSTMRFFSSGVPFGVNGLTHTLSDIDSSDNEQFDDRCDFVTVTGDAGNPALTAVSATPTFIIGPGPGTGLTGPIAANQAQCKYIDGLGVAVTSDNDITGTMRATYPNNTTLATIYYDESIGNVRGFRFDEDPYARGASTWEAVFFTATQAISLSVAPSVTTAFQGDTVTYSYVVSNDGNLPFNTGQTIVIQDSRLGSLSCPPITSDIAPGETFTCTGSTTVSAGDAAAGSISTTATAGIGPSGQLFADRLQSNTDATLVTILSQSGPAFPTGPGLSSSVCGATSPTGDAFADVGVRWENSGTTSGSIDRSDIFATVGPQSVSGLTATINDNDLNLDRSTVPGVFSNSAYISYSFTTQAYAGIAEIYGIGIAGYSATQPFHNQKSGTFDYAIQIDDDPAFGSPQLLMADTRMQDGTMPGAVSVFVNDFGTAIYNFGHYDASGSVVTLDPATTYYVRVYPYNDTASGMDNGQPYTDIVLWDDFMLKAVSCTPALIDAADDDFSGAPVNILTGGVAGNVLDNDTASGAPVNAAEFTITETVPAAPQSPGDPVPFIELSGATEGQVSVPINTPVGTYTISYELCEDALPGNCDTALVTVVVEEVLRGNITGTVYEDANGSGVFDAGEPTLPAGITISLYLDAGIPLDTLDDIFVGTTATLADGTYIFDVLPVGSYRIEIDTAAPQIPAGYTLTTTNPLVSAVVSVGQTTTDQDFGFAPPLADLSITKAALSTVDGTPVTTLQAGTAVDFVITLSNNGPGAPTGVVVQDLLQSGFAYVSDDSAASGTTYDFDTGLWTVGTLSPGSSQVLTVRATMLATGVHTNTAEVIASSLTDPDSDPTVGAATDDLSDGIADDDEATVSLTLAPSGQVLSGRVLLDNGAGGGTAHDGTLSGTETGTNQALVEILDDTGAVLATPEPNASGLWSYALPQGYTGAVTLRVTADTGLLNVSETAQALPALVNADTSDGQLTFTPAAATDYPDLDVGLIRQATLSESQEAAIGAGQVVTLRHEYLADSTGTVTFTITDITQTPADAFTGTLFADPDCDGVPDTVLVGAQPVSAGTRICLVARVTANSGLGQNAVYIFDLTAQTSYSGISFVETDTNTDRLISSGGLGNLVLTKTVRNETQATPEGQSNQGSVGDVLEYRIYVINPSQALATDVVIHDQTPAYTELAEPVPTPLLLGQGLTCTLSAPAVNAAGYAGALRWDCLGTLVPGEQGSVSFKVAIAP